MTGCCAATAMSLSPVQATSPTIQFISERRAEMREDLPEPALPERYFHQPEILRYALHIA